MSVVLRPVEWPDLAQLARLDAIAFADDAWPETTWWAELAGRPRRRYCVAVEADSILGYAGIDCAGDTADVMTIGVAPQAQGKGVGRALLNWMLCEARSAAAQVMLLEVRADNDRARHLYERNGFEHIQTRRRYYQPGDVDAHVMRAHLTKEAS